MTETFQFCGLTITLHVDPTLPPDTFYFLNPRGLRRDGEWCGLHHINAWWDRVPCPACGELNA